MPEESDDITPVVEVLSGLALSDLRAYRLFPACAALRALSRLGPSGASAAREGCDHLLLQQRASGSFGFFGPETAAVEREAKGLSAATDVYLPATFECLWTLAEGLADWSLVAALGRPWPSS